MLAGQTLAEAAAGSPLRQAIAALAADLAGVAAPVGEVRGRRRLLRRA